MTRILLTAFIFCLSFSLSAQYGNGRYTFVFLNTNPNKAEISQAAIDSLQTGHMNNINRLVKDKKMIAAGPFFTGGGVFLFDTNVEETKTILNSDPAIAADRYILEVFSTDPIPHNAVKKTLCTLWDKNEADVEMAMNYYFVRYKSNKENEDIAAVKTNRFTENLIRSVSHKSGQNTIIGALNLNENEGQLIFYQSNIEGGIEADFAAHELVKKGLMTYEHSQIYFPKGVFCEN
ncbi:hypothetical protein EV198_0402 [Roseivirga ehrenbergii]|uniref:YCII-related domain-containing protein n=1 Tax=Roseivirga ehrenbergii (strain DSM 102268 / JCM 13514 / KCTC 12282 / NCIMB 14502 / KMM 6017) TaxID=279360 RepID=A0A150X8K1_ROSEK|nr:hypothetical protein [Roseivirga ehrenbergii]KYG75067.1 hypothetical protein MB14_07690 [Roseivirga ehrenbergii]TCL13573.1 hypothetical protein EV198_0402 [Roseivirga ehrenbergii]